MLDKIEFSEETFETMKSVEKLLPQLETLKQNAYKVRTLCIKNVKKPANEANETRTSILHLFLLDVQNALSTTSEAIIESLKEEQHKPQLIKTLVEYSNSKIDSITGMINRTLANQRRIIPLSINDDVLGTPEEIAKLHKQVAVLKRKAMEVLDQVKDNKDQSETAIMAKAQIYIKLEEIVALATVSDKVVNDHTHPTFSSSLVRQINTRIDEFNAIYNEVGNILE